MEEVLLPTSLYFLIKTLNPSCLEAQCISSVRVQLVLLLLEVSACRCRKTLSCSSCPEASSCLWKTTSTISTRDQQVNWSMLHFLSLLTHTSSLLMAQPSSFEGASSDHLPLLLNIKSPTDLEEFHPSITSCHILTGSQGHNSSAEVRSNQVQILCCSA